MQFCDEYNCIDLTLVTAYCSSMSHPFPPLSCPMVQKRLEEYKLLAENLGVEGAVLTQLRVDMPDGLDQQQYLHLTNELKVSKYKAAQKEKAVTQKKRKRQHHDDSDRDDDHSTDDRSDSGDDDGGDNGGGGRQRVDRRSGGYKARNGYKPKASNTNRNHNKSHQSNNQGKNKGNNGGYRNKQGGK